MSAVQLESSRPPLCCQYVPRGSPANAVCVLSVSLAPNSGTRILTSSRGTAQIPAQPETRVRERLLYGVTLHVRPLQCGTSQPSKHGMWDAFSKLELRRRKTIRRQMSPGFVCSEQQVLGAQMRLVDYQLVGFWYQQLCDFRTPFCNAYTIAHIPDYGIIYRRRVLSLLIFYLRMHCLVYQSFNNFV